MTDLVGSPVMSVDTAGVVGGVTHYDPFGAPRPGNTASAGIGYAGEYRDPTGLINLRARSYDPVLGRFIGRDTFGGVASAPQTGNRYAYATSNPLRYSDPSGHFVQAAIDRGTSKPAKTRDAIVSTAGTERASVAVAAGIDLGHVLTHRRPLIVAQEAGPVVWSHSDQSHHWRVVPVFERNVARVGSDHDWGQDLGHRPSSSADRPPRRLDHTIEICLRRVVESVKTERRDARVHVRGPRNLRSECGRLMPTRPAEVRATVALDLIASRDPGLANESGLEAASGGLRPQRGWRPTKKFTGFGEGEDAQVVHNLKYKRCGDYVVKQSLSMSLKTSSLS